MYIPVSCDSTVCNCTSTKCQRFSQTLKKSKFKINIHPLTFQVYRMSTPTRGRCLVINNRYFDQEVTSPGQQKLEHRDGSEMDVKNISKVFKRLSFDCDIKTDLSAHVCTRNTFVGRFGYPVEHQRYFLTHVWNFH